MNIIWNPVAVEDDGSEWVQRSEAEAKIRAAVAAEREACAQIANEAIFNDDSRHRRSRVAEEIRDAIRAQSETERTA